MAKKGGLGTPVGTLLKGSSRQRQNQLRQSEKTAVSESSDADEDVAVLADKNKDKRKASTAAETSRPTLATVDSDSRGTADKPKASDRSTVEETVEVAETASGDRLIELELDQIRPGSYQPRRNFDELALQELADSLKEQGLVQPILVRSYAGSFEIIAGERRWRAAELAGFTTIPAIVRDLDDRSVAAVSLIENIQRKDLNALEEANALHRLRSEFGMTQEAVAESVGRSRAAVANLLRLLDLHEDVKTMLEAGEIDMGHARALLALDLKTQPGVAGKIAEKGLSVRATEALVRDLVDGKSGGSDRKSKKPQAEDPNISALKRQLGDKLGAEVQIIQSQSGAGRLEIKYNSLDELDGILAHIK